VIQELELFVPSQATERAMLRVMLRAMLMEMLMGMVEDGGVGRCLEFLRREAVQWQSEREEEEGQESWRKERADVPTVIPMVVPMMKRKKMMKKKGV